MSITFYLIIKFDAFSEFLSCVGHPDTIVFLPLSFICIFENVASPALAYTSYNTLVIFCSLNLQMFHKHLTGSATGMKFVGYCTAKHLNPTSNGYRLKPDVGHRGGWNRSRLKRVKSNISNSSGKRWSWKDWLCNSVECFQLSETACHCYLAKVIQLLMALFCHLNLRIQRQYRLHAGDTTDITYLSNPNTLNKFHLTHIIQLCAAS